MLIRAVWLAVAGILAIGYSPAIAGVMREIRPLTFGSVTVTGAAPQTVQIGADNTESHSGGILTLHNGANGIYQLSNFPANTLFTVDIADTVSVRVGTGQTFDIKDFTTQPANADTPRTDGAGNMTIRIGATLATRSGVSYPPGAYRGTYTLMINF